MIFECGPQGADKLVCEYLGSHVRGDVAFSSITLDNKANLMRDAGQAARKLLADGCCCVLIVWDLRPAWDSKSKLCRRSERESVLASMDTAGIDATAPVHLICIEQELESWLLADDGAISALLSTAAHRYPVRRVKNPDRVPQPKAAMINHFQNARGWRYDDKVNAIQVLRAAPINLPRLRQSTSFKRFEQKLLAC